MGFIVCAFPATGKTTIIRNIASLGYTACDSDSEDHHWNDRSVPPAERVARIDWPRCYVDHLLEMAKRMDVVFCSTHQEVRDALVAAGVPFVVVYPTRDQKPDFLDRVRNRTTGLHGDWGCTLLNKNWDTWLTGMEGQAGCTHLVLQPGQYLADVMPQLLASGR